MKKTFQNELSTNQQSATQKMEIFHQSKYSLLIIIKYILTVNFSYTTVKIISFNGSFHRKLIVKFNGNLFAIEIHSYFKENF